MCRGVPKPGTYPAPLPETPFSAEPSIARHSSTASREREHRPQEAQRAAAGQMLLAAADVGDDEHVEHHHRAGVDDDLGRGDELGAQQQEQRRQADQVHDEREHAVERVAQRHHRDRAGQRADRRQEEEDRAHGAYSPSRRSGVRSIGSASSISLVKIRSERV